MASTSRQRDGVVGVCEIVGEELQCAICRERLKMPRMLSCVHSFCTNCLQECASGGTVSCALCRKVTKLPEHGITGLKLDFRAKRMVDALNDLDRHNRKLNKSVHLCDICIDKKDSPHLAATIYCQNCRQLLCEECATVHAKLACSKDHTASDIIDLVNGKVKLQALIASEDSDQNKKCSEHPDELLKLFCKQCRDPVCSMCLIFGPCKDHENCVKLLGEIVPELSNELTLLSDRLSNAEERFDEVLASVADAFSNIENKRKDLRNKLHETKDDCIRNVNEYHQKLSSKKDELIADQVDKLKDIKQQIESAKTVAKNSSELAKQLIESKEADGIDVAAMYGSVSATMNDTLSIECNELKERVSQIVSLVNTFYMKSSHEGLSAALVRKSEILKTMTLPEVLENSLPKCMIYHNKDIVVLCESAECEVQSKSNRCPKASCRSIIADGLYISRCLLKFKRTGSDLFTDYELPFEFEKITSFALLLHSSIVLIEDNQLHVITNQNTKNISQNLPMGRSLKHLTTDSQDNIYVVDAKLKQVHVLLPDGSKVKSLSLPSSWTHPRQIAISAGTPAVIAVVHSIESRKNANVSLLDYAGSFLRTLDVQNGMLWESATVRSNDVSFFVRVSCVCEQPMRKDYVYEYSPEGELLNGDVCKVPIQSDGYEELFAVSNDAFAFLRLKEGDEILVDVIHTAVNADSPSCPK